MKKIFISGSAGFIGFHLCKLHLEELTGYKPYKNFKDGVFDLVEWYKKYYDVKI